MAHNSISIDSKYSLDKLYTTVDKYSMAGRFDLKELCQLLTRNMGKELTSIQSKRPSPEYQSTAVHCASREIPLIIIYELEQCFPHCILCIK